MRHRRSKLYDEYNSCKDMHFDEAITRALKARKYEDARKLEIQKAKPGYETSEALSDEVRPRLAHLQTLLATRLDELANNREIDNCEICGQYMDMIEKVLNGTKL